MVSSGEDSLIGSARLVRSTDRVPQYPDVDIAHQLYEGSAGPARQQGSEQGVMGNPNEELGSFLSHHLLNDVAMIYQSLVSKRLIHRISSRLCLLFALKSEAHASHVRLVNDRRESNLIATGPPIAAAAAPTFVGGFHECRASGSYPVIPE